MGPAQVDGKVVVPYKLQPETLCLRLPSRTRPDPVRNTVFVAGLCYQGRVLLGVLSFLVTTLTRLLPVGAVRGGLWSVFSRTVGDTERELLHVFTRTLYPLWLVVSAGLVTYGLIGR